MLFCGNFKVVTAPVCISLFLLYCLLRYCSLLRMKRTALPVLNWLYVLLTASEPETRNADYAGIEVITISDAYFENPIGKHDDFCCRIWDIMKML